MSGELRDDAIDRLVRENAQLKRQLAEHIAEIVQLRSQTKEEADVRRARIAEVK